jgi:fatty acid-binding protein DegV
MPGVHVVTDSSCDLAPAEIEPLDVEIVPLTIRFGADEYTDRLDLSVADFYDMMARTDELPQTACPSPGAFEDALPSRAICPTPCSRHGPRPRPSKEGWRSM